MRLPASSRCAALDSPLAELSPSTRVLLEAIVTKLGGTEGVAGGGTGSGGYRPERTLAGEDFLPVWFLRVGAERARAVARLEVVDGERTYFGTGFMLSPDLLMTNHHVLPSAGLAAQARVLFDDEDDEQGRPRSPELFMADPGRLFVTNARLDFALVAVEGQPGARFGTIPLRHGVGGLREGARVNIIQHPSGGRKRVVVHGNRVTQVADAALHYLADTEGGSSGSPVFNARWELLALHHWGGDHDNVGVRIDAILKYLSVAGAARGASPLLRELLDGVADGGDFGAFSTAGLTPPRLDAGETTPERAALDWMGGAEFIDPGHWDLGPVLEGAPDGPRPDGSRVEAIAGLVEAAGADFMILEGLPEAWREPLAAAIEARGLATMRLARKALLCLDEAVRAEAVALTGEAAELAGDSCRGRRLLPEDFAPLRLELERPGSGTTRAFYVVFVEVEGATDLPSRAHRNELARVLGALALATGRDVFVLGSLAGVLPRPGLVELVAPPELTIFAGPERLDDPDVGAIAWIGDGRGADLEQVYCAPELRSLRVEAGVERRDWRPAIELPPSLRTAGPPLLLRARFGELDRVEAAGAESQARSQAQSKLRELAVDAHVKSLLILDDA